MSKYWKLVRNKMNSAYSENNRKTANQLEQEKAHALQLKSIELQQIKTEKNNTQSKIVDLYSQLKQKQREIKEAKDVQAIIKKASSAGFGEIADANEELVKMLQDRIVQETSHLKDTEKQIEITEKEYDKLLRQHNEALKVRDVLNNGRQNLIKKEDDRIKKEKNILQQKLDNDYYKHKLRTNTKNRISKTYQKPSEKNSLLDIFASIRYAVEVLKLTGEFDDGCSHSEHLIPDLEIVLMLEPGCHVNNNNISIHFRRSGQIEPCIKILIDLSNLKNALITNVDIKKCEQNDSNIKVRHCYIIIVILLCSYLELETIQVRDCDCYTPNQSKNYRDSQLHTTKNLERPAYSHHFSYFAPYYFEDVLYNTQVPVLGTETEDSLTATNGITLKDQITNDTFILMTRKTIENDKHFKNYLQGVEMKDIKTMEALSVKLKEKSGSELEDEPLFKLLDPVEKTAFGSYSTYSYRV